MWNLNIQLYSISILWSVLVLREFFPEHHAGSAIITQNYLAMLSLVEGPFCVEGKKVPPKSWLAIFAYKLLTSHFWAHWTVDYWRCPPPFLSTFNSNQSFKHNYVSPYQNSIINFWHNNNWWHLMVFIILEHCSKYLHLSSTCDTLIHVEVFNVPCMFECSTHRTILYRSSKV